MKNSRLTLSIRQAERGRTDDSSVFTGYSEPPPTEIETIAGLTVIAILVLCIVGSLLYFSGWPAL